MYCNGYYILSRIDPGATLLGTYIWRSGTRNNAKMYCICVNVPAWFEEYWFVFESGLYEYTRVFNGSTFSIIITYVMQLEVESTGVTDRLAFLVAPPQRRRVGVAVGAVRPSAPRCRLLQATSQTSSTQTKQCNIRTQIVTPLASTVVWMSLSLAWRQSVFKS